MQKKISELVTFSKLRFSFWHKYERNLCQLHSKNLVSLTRILNKFYAVKAQNLLPHNIVLFYLIAWVVVEGSTLCKKTLLALKNWHNVRKTFWTYITTFCFTRLVNSVWNIEFCLVSYLKLPIVIMKELRKPLLGSVFIHFRCSKTSHTVWPGGHQWQLIAVFLALRSISQWPQDWSL